jgi:hypothetical protein
MYNNLSGAVSEYEPNDKGRGTADEIKWLAQLGNAANECSNGMQYQRHAAPALQG